MKNVLKVNYNYIRKGVRFCRFLKHTFYFFARAKKSDYRHPPDGLRVIGNFDRKRLIQTEKKYEKYFLAENLNRDSGCRLYKKHKVDLVYDEGRVLIRKKFIGPRKFDDFYSELICYEKISHLNLTPDIIYVDFKKGHIYMEYIDGINLSIYRKGIKEFAQNHEELIRYQFNKIVRLLHANGIIFNDLTGHNMIMKDEKLYIFDFADAIYFSEAQLKLYPVKRFFLWLVRDEKNKARNELQILQFPKKAEVS